MALELDADVSRKITKLALAGFALMFLLSPVQPLLGSTLMGLCAIVPVLLGPNPMRVLGLMAFALAGYLFWPEFQESKKVPTRLAVRESLQLLDPHKAALAAFVAKEKRLPAVGELALKLPESDKVSAEAVTGGGFRLRLKFAPLEGRSVNDTPTLTGDKLSWLCVSEDIEQSYLPRQCRNAENLRKARAAGK